MRFIWMLLPLVLSAPVATTVKHTKIVTVTYCGCATITELSLSSSYSDSIQSTAFVSNSVLGIFVTSKSDPSIISIVTSGSMEMSSTTSLVNSATTTVLKESSDVASSSESSYESSLSEDISESSQVATPSIVPSKPIEKLSVVNSNFHGQFMTSCETLWTRFWSSDKFNAHDQICTDTSFTAPSVWELAVVSRAVVLLGDIEKTNKVLSSLYAYENKELKVFSASTAGDGDIYNDDNGQIAWSFIDGYKLTKEEKYLDSAKSIVDFLMNQTDSNGGVLWHYNQDYIASISTSEATLAAMRLYEITGAEELLTFSKKCMDFMFTYFQDPQDKLFYDGLNSKDYTDINKGKLTYSVGVTLSTLALLHKFDTYEDWISKMVELADAALNSKGAFYTGDGIWNNAMKYSHLLFTGLNDIIELNLDQYKSSLLEQGNYIMTYLQDTDEMFFDSIGVCTSSMIERYKQTFEDDVDKKDIKYCNDVAVKSLMDNGSVLQILYQMSRNF